MLEKLANKGLAMEKFARCETQCAVCSCLSQITALVHLWGTRAVICDRQLPALLAILLQPSNHFCPVSNSITSTNLFSALMYKGHKASNINKYDMFLLSTTTIKDRLEKGSQNSHSPDGRHKRCILATHYWLPSYCIYLPV